MLMTLSASDLYVPRPVRNRLLILPVRMVSVCSYRFLPTSHSYQLHQVHVPEDPAVSARCGSQMPLERTPSLLSRTILADCISTSCSSNFADTYEPSGVRHYIGQASGGIVGEQWRSDGVSTISSGRKEREIHMGDFTFRYRIDRFGLPLLSYSPDVEHTLLLTS